MENQTKSDSSQLSILSILHFIAAGLAVLGGCFVGLHYAIFYSFFSNPQAWTGKSQPPPPEWFVQLFFWVYVLFGLVLLLSFVSNIVSAFYIRARKHRIFSIVVATFNCIHMPLGTLLGVFTIVVLMRESVRKQYEQELEQLT